MMKSCLYQQLYPQNELICYNGDIGNKMYFISTGKVELLLGDEMEILFEILDENDFFGEGALLHGRRAATARARTSCELLSLCKKDFQFCMKDYPKVHQNFLSFAMKQKYRMKKRVSRKAMHAIQFNEIRNRKQSVRNRFILIR